MRSDLYVGMLVLFFFILLCGYGVINKDVVDFVFGFMLLVFYVGIKLYFKVDEAKKSLVDFRIVEHMIDGEVTYTVRERMRRGPFVYWKAWLETVHHPDYSPGPQHYKSLEKAKKDVERFIGTMYFDKEEIVMGWVDYRERSKLDKDELREEF